MTMHTQDVRRPGSPPIIHVVEIATTHLLPNQINMTSITSTKARKRKRKADVSDVSDATDVTFVAANGSMHHMKPLTDAVVATLGNGPERTYPVKLGTAMYVHSTYFFPMRAELLNVRVHWHPTEGDEIWLVRGRQEDMDIPMEARKPVVFTSQHLTRGKAVEVPLPAGRNQSAAPGRIDSAAFKKSIEHALALAARRWKAKSYRESNGSHPHRRSDDTFMMRHNISWEQNPATLAEYVLPRVPTILCKFYGQTDDVSAEDIRQRAAVVDALHQSQDPAALSGRLPRANISASSEATIHFKARHASSYSSIDTSTTVSPDEQRRNMFTGALPGSYYRAGARRGGHECESFDMQTGEFLTVIHFLEPRSRPAQPEEVFDPTDATTNQHTVFSAMLRFMDANKIV